MSVVIGIHLLDCLIISSDSRYTKTSNKKTEHSDTAPKIFQLNNQQVVAVVGNPFQADKILKNLNNKAKKEHIDISPKYILKSILEIAEKTPLVNTGDTNCILIFAGIEKTKNKTVSLRILRKYYKKVGQSFFTNWNKETSKLITMYLNNEKYKGHIEFHVPKTYLFAFHFPSYKMQKIPIMSYNLWGRGKKIAKKFLKEELQQLIIANFERQDHKALLLAIRVVKSVKTNKESSIGGFPQTFFIDFSGNIRTTGLVMVDNKRIFPGIKIENDRWIQKKSNKKLIKINKSLSDKPEFKKGDIYFENNTRNH